MSKRIKDKHSVKDIMKSEGIPDLLIRRSLGVVGAGPPPIPKFIDVQEAMVRPSSPQDHELPSSDNFEPAHDDLSNPLLL